MMTRRHIRKGVNFILFVLAFSSSLAINTFVAAAATLAPGDRQQLNTRSRETGERFTDAPSRNEALNDSRATPSTPPAPPGSAPLPPLGAPEAAPLPRLGGQTGNK